MNSDDRSVRGRWLVSLVVLGLLHIVPGCGGGGPERVPVAGQVTYDGEPVQRGTIRFAPLDVEALDEDDPLSHSGSAQIENGQYDTAAGTRVVPGRQTVQIHAYDGQADEANELPYGQPLFKSYETEVEIEEATGAVDFEISPADVRR